MNKYWYLFTIKSLTLRALITILAEANAMFCEIHRLILRVMRLKLAIKTCILQSISENHCNGMGENTLYGQVL